MIVGLGLDVVELSRIERTLGRFGEAFSRRILTPAERDWRGGRLTAPTLAGCFAAKEAAVKALGTGFSGGIGFQCLEILPDALGRPVLRLSGPARERASEIGADAFHISITHGPGHGRGPWGGRTPVPGAPFGPILLRLPVGGGRRIRITPGRTGPGPVARPAGACLSRPGRKTPPSPRAGNGGPGHDRFFGPAAEGAHAPAPAREMAAWDAAAMRDIGLHPHVLMENAAGRRSPCWRRNTARWPGRASTSTPVRGKTAATPWPWPGSRPRPGPTP
jgi:holo-[acyl-carrier protein] synthase